MMRARVRKRLLSTPLILTITMVLGACLPLLEPPAAQGAGLVIMNGCTTVNTSAWKTDSNGGSFGLRMVCPGSDPSFYPDGLSLGGGSASDGQYASWYTSVPAGMELLDVSVQSYYARGLTAGGWAGDWKVGGQTIALANTTSEPGGIGGRGFGPSQATGTLFGWSIQCRAAGGCSNDGDLIQVGSVTLQAQETQGPTMSAPTGLWASSGYVWGNWTVAVTGNGPSGVCDLSASLDGHALPGATSRTPDQSVWDQCDGQASLTQPVDIANGAWGEGGVPLVFTDQDAAGWGGPVQKTVDIDDIPPQISLSGPTDASSAAGTQYVTATATTTGPSGVKGISCSLDGAPAQLYPGASASIPVSGLGDHRLSCVSESNSYNASGQALTSTPASTTVSIGEPSLSVASFSAIKGLKCGKVRAHVKIPARWVKVRRHGHLVPVRRPARTVVRRVERCRVRVVVKRVCHAGHCHKERRVKLPHVVLKSTRRVPYGQGTTVSGWVLTAAGAPVAGQQVRVLTAPDNGSNAFTVARSVTTASDGAWTAKLPAGPSRLVEAVYGGASLIEPASSPPIKLLVPAKVKIRVAPHRSPWGGTVKITGRVLGGYIPGGKLLRLRIGVAGAGVKATAGIPSVAADGRFSTTYTFNPGRGVVRYWFSISTLGEPDYAFAPGSSKRVYVTIGPG
jgi:hypothetical protein